MKKFIAICLALVLSFSAVLTLHLTNLHHFPNGNIYNYFEYASGGNLVRNLDDYVAANTVDSIILFDKKTQKSVPLADSVFDCKMQMPFLLHTSGNTLYYFCKDRQTKCFTYYSFNLDTYEKTKLTADSAVVNQSGFLGMERVLGIDLYLDQSINISGNLGRNWINASGVHSSNERRKFLAEQEDAEQFGVQDSIQKIAETDRQIYFQNFFGELVCFDKEEKSFQILLDQYISDFFITGDTLYYVTDEAEPALYKAEISGKNPEKIEGILPVCVKFAKEKVYVADKSNTVYEISTAQAKKIAVSPTQSWVADEGGVYSFNHNNQMFMVVGK